MTANIGSISETWEEIDPCGDSEKHYLSCGRDINQLLDI
jgi:hypothetical protein